MSRLDGVLRTLLSAFPSSTDSGDSSESPDSSTAGDARRRYEFMNRRHGSPTETQVEKNGEVERRAETYATIESNVAEQNGVRKPYDPLYLRDLSQNAVIQAYIDTLSQDVASASWSVKPRDDRTVDDDRLAEIEREIKQLHPDLPFRDVLESTTRILLELGDAVWVKHYYRDGDGLAEIVPVDSASMFKRTNDYGMTDGYVQASRTTREVEQPFDESEVVWFSWSKRPDRYYGQGPVEKAQGEIQLLEELTEKERLDLVAGSPPGVVSPDYQDEFGGSVPAEDWDSFVDQMILDEGERHRVGYSKIPVDFEPLSGSYQDLQILERSKYWVGVLGSVFKVNPSYAGFDFQNTNRATDESQQQAYAQRGFRVTLRQLEESINRGLLWSEFGDDVVFRFEQEQTVDERKTRAELLKKQAKAGQDMANALDESDGTVSYRDGEIVVEDGEITPDEDGDVGGGLFGSTDAGFRKAVDAADLVFDSEPEAARVADLLGLSGTHTHDDGDSYMPGESHDKLVSAVERVRDAADSDDSDDAAKEIPDAILDEISEDRFVPPDGVADAARRALELIDEHGRDTVSGGTREGLARARQIIDHNESNDPLIGTNDDGVPYVVEIANFHARHRAQGNHEYDADEHDNKYADPGWFADLLWGSDAGNEWSSSLADRIDEVEQEQSVAKTPSGVPENANGPVSDPGEIPDGASTFQGPQGGTYWLAPGDEAFDTPEQRLTAAITGVDVEATNETEAERVTGKYQDTAAKTAERFNNPDVAAETFETIGELFVNDFRTGINFQAGTSKDTSSFEVQSAEREPTYMHEFGHAIGDAFGFGVSGDAAREGDIKYDTDEDNFVPVDLDRDDVDEFKITQLEDRDDVPQEVETLMQEVNNSWEKIQETGQNNPDELDDVVIKDNYGSLNAHETLAQLNEIMQVERWPAGGNANWFDEHGDLLAAYTDVIEPSDKNKQLIKHLHFDRGPENSPFDEDPYPDVNRP